MIPGKAYSYDRTASRLPLSPGKLDVKATESLQKIKLYAKNRGDLQSAIISAGYYANRLGKTMFVYPGNSYGHGVWRVSENPSEYLNPINNTGDRLASVTPELVVSWHTTRTRSE